MKTLILSIVGISASMAMAAPLANGVYEGQGTNKIDYYMAVSEMPGRDGSFVISILDEDLASGSVYLADPIDLDKYSTSKLLVGNSGLSQSSGANGTIGYDREDGDEVFRFSSAGLSISFKNEKIDSMKLISAKSGEYETDDVEHAATLILDNSKQARLELKTYACGTYSLVENLPGVYLPYKCEYKDSGLEVKDPLFSMAVFYSNDPCFLLPTRNYMILIENSGKTVVFERD